jgi:AAA+ ATPase superfamily predicted ATPase
MIDIQEIVNIADELIFSHIGEHLNDLQKTVLLGTIQGKSYLEIASEAQYTEKYIKDTAGKLWKILSESVGEKVKKSNVKATIERCYYSSNNIFQGIQINSGNICRDTSSDMHSHQEKTVNHEDLSDAPNIENFYGRMEELKELEQKIIQEKCNLINIVGVKGIGKTALSLNLVAIIKPHFDYVIYKSLKSLPTLSQLIREIISVSHELDSDNYNNDSSDKITQFKEILKKHRYLIILDDVNWVFSPIQSLGSYNKGYEEYSILLTILSQTQYQSCIIINSCEYIRELNDTMILELSGLGNESKHIINDYSLQGKEYYEELISIYEGNPLYLKIISSLIRDLFAGNIAEFLSYEQPFFDHDLIDVLRETLSFLITSEIQLLKFLANQRDRISMNQIKKHPNILSSKELINNLQSLKRRLMISLEQQDDQIYVAIPFIIKNFIISYID